MDETGKAISASEVDYCENNSENCDSNKSCYCDMCCNGCVLEWETEVSQNGELFYVRSRPLCDSAETANCSDELKPNSKRKGFAKLVHRRKRNHKIKKDSSVPVSEICGETIQLIQDSSTHSTDDRIDSLVAVLYMDFLSSDETLEMNKVYYCFPSSKDNVLYSVRGPFLTLASLFTKIASQNPESSSMMVKDTLVHVAYVVEKSEIMIIAAPSAKCSCLELVQFSKTVTHYLRCRFQTLHRCFSSEEHHTSLDNFFAAIFDLLTNGQFAVMSQSSISPNVEVEAVNKLLNFFTYPVWLPLPNEVQMAIDDMLNEFESSNFEDMVDGHYGCQRSYIVVGTALYHKGYLVATHLNKEDQYDVHCSLTLEGLVSLSRMSYIDCLIVWREIYLTSCGLGILEQKRWFILTVGQGSSVISALLESGGSAAKSIAYPPPDELYVDALQETLANINSTGLEQVVSKMLTPRKLATDTTSRSKKALSKSVENVSSPTHNVPTSASNRKDITSVCRRHGSAEASSLSNSSMLSTSGSYEDTSDTVSKATCSLISDAPESLLGRRAQRLQQSTNTIDTLVSSPYSDSEDSDRNFLSGSQFSLFSDKFQNSCSVTERFAQQLDGDVLFYYVDVNAHKGVLLCPPTSTKMNCVLNNFKNAVEKISLVLNEPLLVKQTQITNTCDAKCKDTIPVKEYGILFELDNTNSEDRNMPEAFWVVGRLFTKPWYRQVYICYDDRVPQNVVEVAFTLALSTA